MVELTEDEKKIVDTIKSLNATSEDKLKTVDHIAKAAIMPKGKVANIISILVNKRVLVRVAREKAAGYYVVEGAV
jgi:RNA binding exosome subunit